MIGSVAPQVVPMKLGMVAPTDQGRAKNLPPVTEERLPQERVELTALRAPDVQSQVATTSQLSVEAPVEKETVPRPPVTLTLDFPDVASSEVESNEGISAFATVSRSVAAKVSSEANWNAAVDALKGLPEEDRAAAGKRAFYTQAASLPEFAETLASLPPEQQPQFPMMLWGAKEAGSINGDELTGLVEKWSEENPEQSYMAQMSGFADYASEQLAVAATNQGIESLDQFKFGPREQSLASLSNQANDYVVNRGEYLGGAHKLFQAGLSELAQQVLDAPA